MSLCVCKFVCVNVQGVCSTGSTDLARTLLVLKLSGVDLFKDEIK